MSEKMLTSGSETGGEGSGSLFEPKTTGRVDLAPGYSQQAPQESQESSLQDTLGQAEAEAATGSGPDYREKPANNTGQFAPGPAQPGLEQTLPEPQAPQPPQQPGV
jgi:PPE-repeat protein